MFSDVSGLELVLLVPKFNLHLIQGLNSILANSAGRSPWYYVSMFVSEIREQTSNISDHGVKSVNQTEKWNIK